MDWCKFAFLLPPEVRELQTFFTYAKAFLSLKHALNCGTRCNMTNTALHGVFRSACSRQNCQKVRHTIRKSFTLCCSDSAGLGSPAVTVCCAFSSSLWPPPSPHQTQASRYHCWTAVMARRTSEDLRPALDLRPVAHCVWTRQFVYFCIEVGGYGLS